MKALQWVPPAPLSRPCMFVHMDTKFTKTQKSLRTPALMAMSGLTKNDTLGSSVGGGSGSGSSGGPGIAASSM